MAASATSKHDDDLDSPTALNLNILIGHGCVLDGSTFNLHRNNIIYTISEPGEGICLSYDMDRKLNILREEVQKGDTPSERKEIFENLLGRMFKGKAKKHVGSNSYMMNDHQINFEEDVRSTLGHGYFCCINFFSNEPNEELRRANIKQYSFKSKTGIKNMYYLSEIIKYNGMGIYLLWFCRTNCGDPEKPPMLARGVSDGHTDFLKKYLKYKSKYLKLKNKLKIKDF
jgi:hypothetical protein